MTRSRVGEFLFRSLRSVNRGLSRVSGMRIIRDANLYPWQIAPPPVSTIGSAALPSGAQDVLVKTNPRLTHLQSRYRAFDRKASGSPFWHEGTLSEVDLAHFRGHNSFTDQLSGLHANALTYALTYYALKSSPAGDLLARIEEDGAFGANVFTIDGRTISREVLDSAREIEFIRSHVGWDKSPMVMLDIGAGYGRLVHRMSEIGGDQVKAFATDAYAPSTFLSEYYLQYRGLPEGTVIPLDEVEAFLAKGQVTLATNVHSFSECAPEAVDWWVSRLAANRVKHLMIIPNCSDPQTGHALTNLGADIDAICSAHGYELQVREPAHADPAVQAYAVDHSIISLFVLGG